MNRYDNDPSLPSCIKNQILICNLLRSHGSAGKMPIYANEFAESETRSSLGSSIESSLKPPDELTVAATERGNFDYPAS